MSSLDTERTIWVGNNFATIAYGIDIYMVFHSWYLLKGLKSLTPRMKMFYTGFGFVQLLLFTLQVATNAITEQFGWIDHRDFPGGPLAFFSSVSSGWYQILNLSCGVLSLAMSDALLLYRCYIIWNANRRITVFPVLIFIGEIVMGVFFIVETATPNATFFLKQPTSFAVPWISLATSLNTILTGLIVGRILYVSRQAHTSSNYTGVIAILVESAILLTVGEIAFVAAMRANVVESIALSTIVGSLILICPQAIIIRVAMGSAWTETTRDQITTGMEFAEQKTVHSEHKADSGHVVDLAGVGSSESSTTIA